MTYPMHRGWVLLSVFTLIALDCLPRRKISYKPGNKSAATADFKEEPHKSLSSNSEPDSDSFKSIPYHPTNLQSLPAQPHPFLSISNPFLFHSDILFLSSGMPFWFSSMYLKQKDANT